MVRIMTLIAVFTLASTFVHAEQPTTQPAETPQQVFPAIIQAIIAGDEAGVRDRMAASGDHATRVRDAMLDATQRAADFRAALVERFDAAAIETIYANRYFPVELFNQANVTIEGEKATLQMDNTSERLTFNRQHDRWVLDVDTLVEQSLAQGLSLEVITDGMSQVGKQFEKMTGRVRNGDFTTAEQVIEALEATLFRFEGEIDPAEAQKGL